MVRRLSSVPTSSPRNLLRAANAALEKADWAGAAELFRRATVASSESAEAWDGLAKAAYWVPDEDTVLGARERAYHLYNERGDGLSAARMAAWLAVDTIEMRGLEAVGLGWIARAKRLVAGRYDTPDAVWVTGLSARVLVLTGADMASVRRTAGRAAAMARRLGMTEAEALNLAVEGMARLCTGDISRAVPCLDEAAALVSSGDFNDLTAAGLTLCSLMGACERTRDFDRARQWCAVARQFSEDRGFPVVLSICRPHYGAVLMWRGYWSEAEEHLQKGSRELTEFIPSFAVGALALLGGLRWRQGRWEEAEQIFDQIRNEGPAQLGIAELMAGKGDVEGAIDVAERMLRQIPPADKLERGPALELLVRCLAASGEYGRAAEHLEELCAIAQTVRTPSLQAAAALAQGSLAHATGNAKAAEACLGDAVALYERASAPFESSRARIALAQALQENGRLDAAAREAQIASDSLLRIGAAREAERAGTLLANIKAQRSASPRLADGLTPREMEILGLLAEGSSNQEIADTLVLSVRTVERHISNIYQKLSLEGRSARTAAAARAHRLKLSQGH